MSVEFQIGSYASTLAEIAATFSLILAPESGPSGTRTQSLLSIVACAIACAETCFTYLIGPRWWFY
ncbi:hypothetical protein BGW80DRAFT_923723 [Lactifluus volemus]|nr:hypothetical protein BGW80DRAFT_923723 [Lactifluus volemus]